MGSDSKPEAVSERSALPWGCKHTNLYQTLPVEIVVWAFNVPLYSKGKLKKILPFQRSALSLKIVLFPLSQAMSKIVVARRFSIFVTAALLWAAEQFLCIALQLLYLGLNKLFSYFLGFSSRFSVQ